MGERGSRLRGQVAVAEKIPEAIEYILAPLNFEWIQAMANGSKAAPPDWDALRRLSHEEGSVRYSNVEHEQAPPRPDPPTLCEGEGPADWVSRLQELLSTEGFLDSSHITGVFGP